MVLFTNLQSVERILCAIFYRFNQPTGAGCTCSPRNKESGLYLQPVL